ncbi:MAG: hypothetical protein Q9172_007297 [Xanthocarpia lactea]
MQRMKSYAEVQSAEANLVRNDAVPLVLDSHKLGLAHLCWNHTTTLQSSSNGIVGHGPQPTKAVQRFHQPPTRMSLQTLRNMSVILRNNARKDRRFRPPKWFAKAIQLHLYAALPWSIHFRLINSQSTLRSTDPPHVIETELRRECCIYCVKHLGDLGAIIPESSHEVVNRLIALRQDMDIQQDKINTATASRNKAKKELKPLAALMDSLVAPGASVTPSHNPTAMEPIGSTVLPATGSTPNTPIIL